MPLELSLTFPDPDHVQVSLRGQEGTNDSSPQPFAPPLDQKIRQELTWYLETYPAHYTTELDDTRAAGIAAKLKDWGGVLFKSVCADLGAHSLFAEFQRTPDAGRLLTVSSLHPTVLAQPWELLCDPNSTFLYLHTPRISIRRRLPGGLVQSFRPAPKDKVHLLFVVSRPDDAGLIDPRADPMAVMDALDAEAPGRVTVEFLRPPTLQALITRLNDDRKPPVDILHFDGHGAYDPDGQLSERSRQAISASGAGHLLRAAEASAHHGYLLFEDETHKSALVPASIFGDLLQSKRVGLVILSACQSAMVSGEDVLGSVAPRLIRAGIPSVLAMTQSVLVPTTRALSRFFYRDLVAGRPIGAALDAARTHLYAAPKRGERQRASGTVSLELQDWFVPALYQAGADGALLKQATEAAEPPPAPRHNLLEEQESGFHGRTRELRDIERWFVGDTRRIVISGFGGQGKTAQAIEAGRWLLRTGLFARVCFVSYAGFQGRDAVQLAVSTLGTVLDANLIDAKAARDALRRTSTLLILDNLEALPADVRAELLTEASSWSLQGSSRVLITTRPDDLGHPDYPAEGSNRCRHLRLAGLASQDALDWFQAQLNLPPEPSVAKIPPPDVVRELFAQVGFHPLSIGVLTGVLKQRRIADVAEALAAQLTRNDDPLLASLNLSLERLDAEARAALPGLGVFIDGAWEPILARVLELEEATWGRLRDGLRQAGLATTEAIPGISTPFLRFHPTLAPAMRARLASQNLARLGQRYRAEYYLLSRALYLEDGKNPEAARGIARRELSNLLAAVFAAFEQEDDTAVDFADNVNLFLSAFGRRRDLAALQLRAEARAGALGSDSWYLSESNRGEQLFARGQYGAAKTVFIEMLGHPGDAPSHRRAVTLLQLARCDRQQGLAERAEVNLRQALRELAHLAADRGVLRLKGDIQADLGDVLMDRGDLDPAQAEHEAAIASSKEIEDERGIAVGNAQLGKIYLLRRDFPRAAQNYRDAIRAFERLNEPGAVAIGYHQLGCVLAEAGVFSEAENAFREAARIRATLGDQVAAARTWMNLANTIGKQGRPAADVEPWYRRALSVFDTNGDGVSKGATLNNMADLLSADSARLGEARDLAAQALTIKQALDPDVAEISKTYRILANIATKQGDAEAARRYRSQERQSLAAAPISREQLRRHWALIAAVLFALRQPTQRPTLETALAPYSDPGWGKLVTALRALLDGARDEDSLCEPLDQEDALIVTTIFRCLSDPSEEQAFLSDKA